MRRDFLAYNQQLHVRYANVNKRRFLILILLACATSGENIERYEL